MADRHIHPHLSQRMPQEILDKIGKYAELRSISRSQAINEATEFYADSKECILCGAVNNGGGKVCSVCGAELFSDAEIDRTISEMSVSTLFEDIGRHDPEIDDIVLKMREAARNAMWGCAEKYGKLGLTPVYENIIDRSGERTVYKQKQSLQTPDGEILEPRGDGTCKNEISFDAAFLYMFIKKTHGIIPQELENNMREVLARHNDG